MHKSATKCNETIGKWCKNKHGASKIIDTFETYQSPYNYGWTQSTARATLVHGSGWWLADVPVCRPAPSTIPFAIK
jgi:hypothetical protein